MLRGPEGPIRKQQVVNYGRGGEVVAVCCFCKATECPSREVEIEMTVSIQGRHWGMGQAQLRRLGEEALLSGKSVVQRKNSAKIITEHQTQGRKHKNDDTGVPLRQAYTRRGLSRPSTTKIDDGTFSKGAGTQKGTRLENRKPSDPEKFRNTFLTHHAKQAGEGISLGSNEEPLEGIKEKGGVWVKKVSSKSQN